MDKPEPTCTIVCLVRDEGPYLLEWMAWHRLLGAARLVIYDNAFSDGGERILAALAAADEIELVSWPDRPDRPPQLDAYADALARCATEWIAFLDADEFLVLTDHDSLADFLSGFPESCGGVVVNQRAIGSNGLKLHEAGLVLERFPLGSGESLRVNRWVKTLARTRCVAAPGIHAPRLAEGDLLNAGGVAVALEDGQRVLPISHRGAYYNHYILKSAEEFARKRARGEAILLRDAPSRSDKYSDAFFRSHDVAKWLDPNVARKLPALRVEHARLLKLVGAAGPIFQPSRPRMDESRLSSG